jgi:branched-chain amino acid transport system permease protein
VNNILAVLFDGVVYASWLFLMAAGLTLIYGVMRILNIAHGSLYALGAYTAATIAGAWLAAGYAAAGSYAMLALAALLVGAVMGPLLERGLLKWMYGRDEVVLLLITYAVFLILEDTIKLVWGVESQLLPEPYALPGNFQIGTLAYPVYNLLLVAVAMLVGLAVAWALYRTRQGKLLLAVIHDREISAAMGINVDRVYLVTFSVGAMLAGLGGALTAPTIAVSPGIGVEVIVLSFAVVVVGGLGSLGGAALGALMVGIVRSIAVRYWPEAELFTIYFVMATVLIARPKGLFSPPEVRKI